MIKVIEMIEKTLNEKDAEIGLLRWELDEMKQKLSNAEKALSERER